MVELVDLKPGMLVEIGTAGDFQGRVYEVESVDHIENVFRLRIDGICYAFRPSKARRVRAVEGWYAHIYLNKGNYLLSGDKLYRKVEGQLEVAYRTADKPWIFSKDKHTLLCDFVESHFEVLEERPDWAKTPKYAQTFKVGDVIANDTNRALLLYTVVDVLSDYSDVDLEIMSPFGGRLLVTCDNYRLASQEEQQAFYSKLVSETLKKASTE